MPHIRRLLVLVAGFAAVAVSGPTFAQKAQGYVLEVSGTVTGQVGTGQPVRVDKGQTLVNNPTITTGPRSYAVLKFEDGTSVLLKENSSFHIQHYTYNPKATENSNVVFNLVRGGLRMVTGLVTSRNRDALKVATPLATMGIRGTDFMAVLVNPLFVQVVNGVVSLTNSAGTVLFSAGQAGIVSSSATLGGLVPMSQVPAGVFQFPNFPLTAVPEVIPSGSPVGGTFVSGGAAAVGIAIGAIGVAAVLSAGNEQSAVTHH